MSGDLESGGLELPEEHLGALVTRLQATLGKQYRIERELGRGGMGVVFLARDLTLDRLVAVKVLHPDLSTNRVLSARFLAEARTIAKLRHPNIVAVHTAGELDGQLYYVMDYLDGESLRQRLARDGRLPVATAVKIASDIGLAVDAASEAGIVHRDLKPENILLAGTAAEPTALLADFGIARLIEGGGGHTGPGAVMGTPAYMSPEQAAGEALDGRSDIYSLGIVTYEMLTGAPPFTGPHRAVISKHILDAVTPVDAIRTDAPEFVARAIDRALDKVPDSRWATGKSFAAALAGTGDPTPAPLPSRRRRRRTRLIAAIAGIAAAAAAVLFFTTRPPGPPAGVDPRRSLLVLPFDNLKDEAAYEWLKDGSVNMLTLSLSQWRDLWVVDQDRVHDLIETSHHEGRIGLDLALRLARQSHAWTVVLGDFTKAGDSLHLVARTYDVATGRRLEVVQVDGPIQDDVRPLFDKLAARLLDLTGAPASDRATVASVTTESVEAYRAYLRGVDLLNHWRLAEASHELERAVATDTTFSLANYKLAVVRGWIGYDDTLGVAAIRRAARTSERLPARDRQLIDAYSTFSSGDLARGAALYGDLIRKDSTDTDAWYGFADSKFHSGYKKMDPGLLTESLRGFQHLIRLDSTYGLAYEHIGAMLTDASAPTGRYELVTSDSLATRAQSAKAAPPRDAAAISRAQKQAVDLAQAWTRLQPNTPRAHYHLYKAYLASGRTLEARQTVAQLRALYPDSLQALFGLLDARAQFVGGDIQGAARTIRAALPKVRPLQFRQLDFAPEPLNDIMTGVDAFGYFGDLQGATQLIRLGRGLYEQRAASHDSTETERWNEVWELSRLAQLHSATGTQPERLRSIWDRAVGISKNVLPAERPAVAEYFAPAAVGLLIGPTADVTAISQLEGLSGHRSPPAVKALVAIRQGDTARAKALLAQSDVIQSRPDSTREWEGGDQRPLLAEAHFELGDYAKVIGVLRDFQPESFSNRGFDPRWILLPRIRLLRGAAFERLHRTDEAMAEYRAVIDQWGGADPELLPAVQRARQGLARLEGIAESRS